MRSSVANRTIFGAVVVMTLSATVVSLVPVKAPPKHARAMANSFASTTEPRSFPSNGLALALAGLDRSALAAAGLSAAEQQMVSESAAAWLANGGAGFAATLAGHQAALKSVRLQSHGSSDTALQNADGVTPSRTRLSGMKDALFASATNHLSNEQVAKLRRIQSLRWTGHDPAVLARSDSAEAATNARESPFSGTTTPE